MYHYNASKLLSDERSKALTVLNKHTPTGPTSLTFTYDSEGRVKGSRFRYDANGITPKQWRILLTHKPTE